MIQILMITFNYTIKMISFYKYILNNDIYINNILFEFFNY